MTFGCDRKSRNGKSDVLSSFLASTCALTIGVNLSWTPPPGEHTGSGSGSRAADIKAILYLVAINWAQCSGTVINSAVGPYRLMTFGVCASFAAAVLASADHAGHAAINAYAVATLQGLGCGSLAVAVPGYIVTVNARGPYRSAALCLIEAFTLVGTLISHASNVLMTRERAGFATTGAVFVNLSALVLISCLRSSATGAVCYRSLTSRPTAAEYGSPTSDPEVDTAQDTAPTTLDTIKSLFAEKEHRNSVISSLALFVLRDFSGIHVCKKCIRHIFNELNTDRASRDQFDLLLIITVVTVFTVEVYGKRRLLLISSLGMLLSTAGLELIVRNADSVDVGAARSACLLAVMLLYVIFYAHGLSSIPWAIPFETIHRKVRSFATGTIISVHFLFLLVAEFSYVNEHLVYTEHSAVPFWIMSLCLLQVIFVDRCVSETKSVEHGASYGNDEP